MRTLLGLLLACCFSRGVTAEEIPTTESLMAVDTSARVFSQLVFLQGGAFTPRSAAVSNGNYRFDYGNNLSGAIAEAGWSIRLFPMIWGTLHLEEGLNYTALTGSATSSIRGTATSESLRLNILGLDNRLMYSADWFPWKRLIPFVDGGYQVSFYSQTGQADLESVQGSTGNFVAGGGFRFWLNRGSFTAGDFVSRVETIPIFLTARYNHVYANGQDLDLGSDSYMFGLQLGL